VPEHDDQCNEEGRDADRDDEEEQADSSQCLWDFGEDPFAVVRDDGTGMLRESGTCHGLGQRRHQLGLGVLISILPLL
jgi:hypothetical protein